MGLTELAASPARLAPPLVHLVLALGLSLFFGFAFEAFYARDIAVRPGGIRTFPLLALAGAALFDVEPGHGTAFAVGLPVVAVYALVFGGRRSAPAAGLLGALAIAGDVLAWLTATRMIG